MNKYKVLVKFGNVNVGDIMNESQFGSGEADSLIALGKLEVYIDSSNDGQNAIGSATVTTADIVTMKCAKEGCETTYTGSSNMPAYCPEHNDLNKTPAEATPEAIAEQAKSDAEAQAKADADTQTAPTSPAQDATSTNTNETQAQA